MTERRPPPSLGTFRPTKDHGRGQHAPNERRESLPEPELHWQDAEGMPRIVTQRGAPPPPRPRRLPPPPDAEEGKGIGVLHLLLYAVGGLLVFAVAAAVAAFVFVPTGLIRDQLQAEVRARTGRDLVIAGPTTLSLWPRPAVSLRDVTLSAPPEMGAQPLLKVAEIEVAIQLLPLLLHDVSIDRLFLRRPVFDLRVDVNGRRSWDFASLDDNLLPLRKIRLAEAGGDAKSLPKELQDFMRGSSDAAARGSKPKSRIGDISLGNVSIVDGTVRYRDARTTMDQTVSALNVQLALLNIASPLDIVGDFSWHNEPVQVSAQLSPFRALLDARPVQAQIKTSAAPLALTFDGVVTPGADLDIDGRLTGKAASLEALARWTGRPLGEQLAGGLSIDAKIRQSSGMTALSDTRVAFGSLEGSGALSFETRGSKPVVKGAVRFATLDLNILRVMANVKPAVQAEPVSAPATAPAGTPTVTPKSIEDLLQIAPATPANAGDQRKQVRGFVKRQGWSDEPLDLTALGLVDADLKIGFDHIVWQELTAGAGQINVVAKGKTARLLLEDVHLYDGRARGIVTIDASAADAVVGANIVADGVSALPFLKAVSDFDWLSGRARIAVAVAGRGATERQIVQTMNGKADIAVADGALMGLNFATIMRNLGQGKFAGLDRSPSEKTDFTEFAASAQISNGLARNDDLRISSAQVKATGTGTIDLPQRTMDYMLRPKVITGSGPGLEVPLKVQGSIDKPTVTPELGGLLRDPSHAVQAIQDAAKTPAGREVQETLKGVLNGDPAARDKVKGFLDQLLKK